MRLDTFANTGGVTIQADGFNVASSDAGPATCAGGRASAGTCTSFQYDIAGDGVVDFVFRAGAIVVNRTDIAIVEALSCYYMYP